MPNGTFLVELVAFAIIVWILGEVRHPADQQGDDGAPGGDPRAVRRARRGQGRGAQGRGGVQGAARRRPARGRAQIREEAREQGAQIVAGGAREGPDRGRPHHRARPRARSRPSASRRSRRCAREVGTPGHRRWPAGSSGECLEDDERSSRVVDRFLADLEAMHRLMACCRRAGAAEALAELTARARTTRSAPAPSAEAARARRRAVRASPAAPQRAGAAPGRHRRLDRGRGQGRAGRSSVFGKAVGDVDPRPARPTPSAAAGRSPRDLADVLERLGVIAVVRSAGAKAGQVSDELFELCRGSSTATRRPARRPVRPGAVGRRQGARCSTRCSTARCCRPRCCSAKQALAGTYGTIDRALEDLPAPRRRGEGRDDRDGARRPAARRRRARAAGRRS